MNTMGKKTGFHDLKNLLELREGEIDELNMELAEKEEKINKYARYITRLKHENELMEIKLNNEVSNEKAKIRELDDLAEKIAEKEATILDKQDQVKYLRDLVTDYKEQVRGNTENLEIQLRKISKTYEGLLEQKDRIIERQDESIKELTRTIEEIRKTNKTATINLELQNKKYQKMIDDMEKR